MAWTCRFIQDTAETGLGTMRAEFKDNGGAIIAIYEQQMKNGNTGQGGTFINKAKAVLAKAQEQIAADAAQQELAVRLAERLNA